MSSAEAFPNLVNTVHPGTMADVSGIVSTEWYTPATVRNQPSQSHSMINDANVRSTPTMITT
jgi:hypothetical protein